MLVKAYFAENGSPKTGLSPTLDIIDLSDGSVVVNDGAMTDRGSGFYIHSFGGYDASKDYSVICDSVTLTGSERYAIGEIESYLGTDGNILISANAQDLSACLDVNTKALGGTVQSATDLKDFADAGYDPNTNKVQGVVLADTVTALTGHTPQTGDSFTRLGAPAGASIAADLLAIDNLVDDLESRLTAARAGYLDELAAANIPADVDTLLTRLSAARAGYLDELAAANIPADIDTLKAYVDELESRLTAARAGYLDKLNITGTLAHSDTAATYKADVSNLDVAVSTRASETGGNVAAIKAKTDNLPSGIPKNVALSDFEFVMVDSEDGKTPLSGLTVACRISLDGAAFQNSTNAASEVGSGLYKIDFTQAERNATVATYEFTVSGADDRLVTIISPV